MSVSDIFSTARKQFRALAPILKVALEVESAKIRYAVTNSSSEIVRVECRVKSFESIRDNYIRYVGMPSPGINIDTVLQSCTDILGIRIVTLYNLDVDSLQYLLAEALQLQPSEIVFSETEIRKGSEFGYRATHWKYLIDDPFLVRNIFDTPVWAEIQLRSVMSDAWARHSRSLLYKAHGSPSDKIIREFAIASATIEGLDMRLDDLFASADEPVRKAYVDEIERSQLSAEISNATGLEFIEDAAESISVVLGLQDGGYGNFVSDVKLAWEKFGDKKFDAFGYSDPMLKLKMVLFMLDEQKYSDLIPPHRQKRVIDFFAAG